jgi:hypothetical protein
MKIERNGREYFAPDTVTDMQQGGVWSGIPHAALLPVDIKALQDAALETRNTLNTQEAEIARRWTEYCTDMAAGGITLPETAPDYAGM